MAVEYIKFNLKDLKKNLKRSLSLLWHCSRSLAMYSLLLQILQAFLPVVSLFFIKEIIEKVTARSGFSEILPIIVYFVSAQLLLSLAQQCATYVTTIYQFKLTDYLSRQVLDKAVRVDYNYYENPAYHDSLHLAQQQSIYRAGGLLTSFNSFTTSALGLLFLLALFISLHSYFALLFIVVSLPLAIIKWYYGIATMQQEKKLAPMEREAGYLHSILTGVSFAKETRVFGFGNYFIEKFNNIRNYILKQKQSLNKKLTHYSLIAEAVEIIVMAIIFAMLAKQSLTGAISIGLFVVYIQGFQSLQNNSKNFLQAIVQILQQRIFLQDLFTFLDIKTEVRSGTQNITNIPTNGIIISHLNFSYLPEKPVLTDISLKCNPGQIIAIVGENGSGKSTLIKLLAKLYAANSGTIYFNGIELDKILEEDYRKQSVFLFQDFEKYFFTIKENIVLGREDVYTRGTNIEKASQLSGADEFISKLSKGYETRMGRIFEGSEQLSGGEWQKLALARVFYRTDASLIVLDEPTSALDARAEFEIFKQLKNVSKSKMIILVTHRLYNLKIADYLYVMQQGSITEQGTFNELLNKNGLFTQLHNMQQL